MTPVRLLVVDDHTLFRRGLLALLGMDPSLQVVGEAGDAAEAVRKAQALQPDLVLLDNHLPGATGIQAMADLKEAAPHAKIVLLTVSEDENDLQLALRGGANGYLLKTIEGDVLTAAIHRIVAGEPVISPELMGKLVAALQGGAGAASAPAPIAVAADTGPALSPREQEVLRQIARGASNKEIARTLDIAETTVKIHVQHILRKLGVSSRVQAAVAVMSGGVRV
ncbi:response regulator [Ramlibacter montanisoli]|uniref:Response regulator transcription factor n=1 Tax=Ramlibacter montanisoli TaxID=2732512 RepID=A0A849KEU8_9BURK|nr:response regulator transcription factor [Ramlibacter montanisoli]NNU43465.1 response regulator transcription factor [Ramlibacter montanisoli]